MLKPDSRGDYALTNYLRTVAIDREWSRAPMSRRTEEMRAIIAAMPHNAACFAPIFNDLTNAVLLNETNKN
jgi:hypothetical protein